MDSAPQRILLIWSNHCRDIWSSWAEQKMMFCSMSQQPLGAWKVEGVYLVFQMTLKGQKAVKVSLSCSRAAVSRTELEDGTKYSDVKSPSGHDSEPQQNICWNKPISQRLRRKICPLHGLKIKAEVKIFYIFKGSWITRFPQGSGAQHEMPGSDQDFSCFTCSQSLTPW